MKKCVELLVFTPVIAIVFIISAFPQEAPSPAGGGWLKLDGDDSFAIAKDDGSFNIGGGEFTIEAWICPEDTLEEEDEWVIIAKPGSFELLLVGGGNPEIANEEIEYAILFHRGIATSRLTSDVLGVELFDEWHHIAVSGERDKQLRMYFDGRFCGFDPNPPLISDSVSDLYVGGIEGKESCFFQGRIDEVQISSKLLVPVVGRLKADEDTVALWHFDEGEGTTLFEDDSSNGHTLTGKGGSAGQPVNPAGKLGATWGKIRLQ